VLCTCGLYIIIIAIVIAMTVIVQFATYASMLLAGEGFGGVLSCCLAVWWTEDECHVKLY